MHNTLFRRIAESEGWPHAAQVDVLLRYIGAQADVSAFTDFLDQCREPETDSKTDPADRFMLEVVGYLANPGLTHNAAFRSFCGNAFGLLMPRQAAERWCCWSVA